MAEELDVLDAEVVDTPAARTATELDIAKPRRTPSPLSHLYQADSPLAPAIDALEADLGGRKMLIEALVGLPDAAGLDYVVGLLADPRSDCRKLSAVCFAGGISLGELLEAVKRGMLITPTLKAMARVAERTPAIVEDVLVRATQHYVPCAVCDGTGSVPGTDLDKPPQPCALCRATGQRLMQPDLETQKVALQLAGLGPKGQPAVALNIDARTQTAIGSMSDLVRATDAVVFPPPPRRVATPAVVDSPAPMPEDPPR